MKLSAYLAVITAVSCLALSATPAQAQEEKPAEKSSIAEKAHAFGKDLDTASQRHFTMIYSNYNIVKVVEGVHEDIEMAVDACGDANPDLEDKLETRFEAWEDAVMPVVDEAEDHVETMIQAQDYAAPKDIEAFLDDVDKDRAARAKDIEKKPVTSAEACEHLYDTLDETESKLTKLLRATLISLPLDVQSDLDQKIQDQKAALEAEEKAKAEDAEAGAEETEAPAADQE